MTGKRLKQPTAPTGALFDPMTGKRLVKKTRSKAVVGLVVLLVVALVGGGVAAAVVLTERSETNERKEAEAERQEACVDELSPVYDALVAVDGRMSTGANIQAFSDVVGQASAARSAVDTDVVEDESCEMFDVLNELVNQYGVILQGWNDCLFEYDYCDTDTDISVGVALSMVSLNQALVSEDDLGTDEAPDDELISEAAEIAKLVAYE